MTVVLLLVTAACGSGETGESAPTTAATASTTVAPITSTTTETPTTSTTTTTAPTTTTTSEPPPMVEIRVAWDGETCSYEGPEVASAGTVASVTYQNDGEVPGDLEIDFVTGGVTFEEVVNAWPEELTSAEEVPTESAFVAAVPEFPNSAQPGESATAEFTLATPRLHIFICWGGGTAAAAQTVDIAATALTVTGG